MKKVVALLAALALVFALAACGGSTAAEEEGGIVGSWVPSGVSVQGMSFTMAEIEELNTEGDPYVSALGSVVLTLKGDGSGSMQIELDGEHLENDVSWEGEGPEYTLTEVGTDYTLTYNEADDTLAFGYQGADLTMVRA